MTRAVFDAPRLDPAIVAELRDVVRAVVREELAAALAPRPRPSRAGLLLAIAEAVRDRAFTAPEVIEHGAVDAALAAALTRAHITEPRSLSKYLWSIEGRAIGGLRVCRIGHERAGIIWKCECVS